MPSDTTTKVSVEDLPELGSDEANIQSNETSQVSRTKFLGGCKLFSSCGCNCNGNCECPCTSQPSKDKGNETGKECNKLDSIFEKIDRRDFILEHIYTKQSKLSSRSLQSLSLRSIHPEECVVELNDNNENVCERECDEGPDDGSTDSKETDPRKILSLRRMESKKNTVKERKHERNSVTRSVSAFFSSWRGEKSNDKKHAKTCNMCNSDFAEGDEVSSSYNKNCPHKFHKECIVKWLMDHDVCPCCDEHFLEKKRDQNTPEKKNPQLKFIYGEDGTLSEKSGNAETGINQEKDSDSDPVLAKKKSVRFTKDTRDITRTGGHLDDVNL